MTSVCFLGYELHPPWTEGTKVLTRDFMRSLSATGVDIHCVSTIDGGSDRSTEFEIKYADQTGFADLAERIGYSRTTTDLPMLIKLAAILRWTVADADVDVVHAGFASHSIFSAVCAVPPSVPFVAQTFGRVENKAWIRRLGTIDRVDAYVTCSSGDAAQLRSTGVPEYKIHRVPPRVEEIDGSREAGRNLIRVDKDAFVVGYIGHVKQERLPDFFLEYLNDFAEESATEAVIITKDCAGREFDRFENITVLEQSLSPSEKADVFAAADVWVFPYDFANPERPPVIDPPLTVLEAMSAGRPVVVSNTLTIPEYVIDEETGILVEPGNHEEIINSLTKFRDGLLDRTSIGANAQRHVRDSFDAETVSSALQDVYSTVTNSS